MQSSKVLKSYSIVKAKTVLLKNEDIENDIFLNNLTTKNILINYDSDIHNLITNNINTGDIVSNNLDVRNGNIKTTGIISVQDTYVKGDIITGNIKLIGDLTCKNIIGESLYVNFSGDITTDGDIYSNSGIFSGDIISNYITSNGINTGSGNIQTTGKLYGKHGIFSKDIKSDLVSCNSLKTGKLIGKFITVSNGNVNTIKDIITQDCLFNNSLKVGDITGTSIDCVNGNIYSKGDIYSTVGIFNSEIIAKNIKSNSINTKGDIKTKGDVISGESVFKRDLTIGKLKCNSFDAGSGVIQTTGIINGNNITFSENVKAINVITDTLNTIEDTVDPESVFAFSPKINCGNVITDSILLGKLVCSSLNTGSCDIQTSGLISGKILNSGKITSKGLIIKNINNTKITCDICCFITPVNIKGGLIIRNTLSPIREVIDTLPSAKNLISELSLSIGDSFIFYINLNNSNSSFSYSLNSGEGGKFRTTSSSEPKVFQIIKYTITITSLTAYDIYKNSMTDLIN